MKQKRCKDCEDWCIILNDTDDEEEGFIYLGCDTENPISNRNGGSFACISFTQRKRRK